MGVSDCLSSDQLKSYALGQLDDEIADQVALHLTDCAVCDETLAGFDDTNDSFVLQVRTAQPTADESPDLDAALQGIAELKSDRAVFVSESSAEDWVRDYRLVGKLGQGGMGTVYKAVHERLQRTVALKLLPARRLRNHEAVARFEREMQAIGRLDHPAIVRATDAGEVEGTHFLAMDYVNGIDLSKVVRLTGPLSIADACEVIRVVATGLSYAHEQGLIHRDVKPSNIMLALSDNGGEANVKLLDLGLALFGAASEAVDDFTTVGQLMGTLDYMAPEQADHSHVGATADVYSLGATLFKLLTGKAPFETRENQSPLQKMKALATMTVPSLKDRLPDAPAALVCIVDQLLQRDPNERISSAAKVSEAMQPFCDGHNLTGLAEQAMQQQALEDARIESELPTSAQPTIPSVMLAKSAESAGTAKPVVASGAGKNNRRWRRWLAGFAAAPLLAFLGVIIWVQTDRGTLKIESVADDVPIEIRQGKEVVESLTLKSGPNEISLRSGRHEVSIAANYDQLQMSNNTIVIQRGGQAIVRVEHVAEGGGSLFRDARTTLDESRPLNETPDPLVSSKANSLIFEGRTYAEWKTILNRERSPEELTKAIDALAALSDDSNAAETCQSILQIMDRIHADVLDVTVESTVLHTGLRRIRELNADKTVPVLQQALESGSAGTSLLIIGELCNSFSHIAAHNSSGNSAPTVRLGAVEPLRTALVKSDPVVEAAFRSFPRWGIEPNRGSLSYFASCVLLDIISARRSAGQTPTPAMLKFCRQVADAGGGPECGIHRYTWVAAIFVLFETTEQKDVPELLWAHMTTRVTYLLGTNQLVFDSTAWQSLADSPVAIRKMLPLLKQHLVKSSGVVMKAQFSVDNGDMRGGFGGSYEDRYFLRSTLITELMGLAEKDAASCVDLLRKQFQEFTGVTPSVDGAYTFGSAEPSICSQLNNLDPVDEPDETHQQEARRKHVQTLLWAWKQITGEPAKFVEPVFPKLAEFPAVLQPKVLTYKGKTIAEWAEYDGSDFESWEDEKQRFQCFRDLSVGDADKPLLIEAKNRLVKLGLGQFHDDEHWFALVHFAAYDGYVDDLKQLLGKVSQEERAKIFCRSLLLNAAVKSEQHKGELPVTSMIVFRTTLMSPDSKASFSPVISEMVRGIPELSQDLQIEVLNRLVAYRGQLSSEALKAIQQLSAEDSEAGFLANLVAARQWLERDPTRNVFMDRLLQHLEQPGEDNTKWINAALSLGVAVRKGATLEQLQRLVKIVEDESASECVDVLWRSTEGDRNGWRVITKTIPVSRRVLALQVLVELAKKRGDVSTPPSDPAQGNMKFVMPLVQLDWKSVRELAGPAGAPRQVVSLILDATDLNQVYYVQSVRPSSSSDRQVASEWAARVLVAAGMMVRE